MSWGRSSPTDHHHDHPAVPSTAAPGPPPGAASRVSAGVRACEPAPEHRLGRGARRPGGRQPRSRRRAGPVSRRARAAATSDRCGAPAACPEASHCACVSGAEHLGGPPSIPLPGRRGEALEGQGQPGRLAGLDGGLEGGTMVLVGRSSIADLAGEEPQAGFGEHGARGRAGFRIDPLGLEVRCPCLVQPTRLPMGQSVPVVRRRRRREVVVGPRRRRGRQRRPATDRPAPVPRPVRRSGRGSGPCP